MIDDNTPEGTVPVITIEDLKHPHLHIDHWRINAGDSWCVVGRNGSGKQYIDHLLTGKLTGQAQGSIRSTLPPEAIRLISFEAQQAIYEEELRLAANDALDDDDTATRARDFLPSNQLNHPLIEQLGLAHRLDNRYRELSTGESRKLLVLQAILEGAQLLILDNPFDSLDRASCESLTSALEQSNKLGTTLLFLLSNRQDIPQWIGDFAVVAAGRLAILGRGQEPDTWKRVEAALIPPTTRQPDWPETALQLASYSHPFLVELRNCTVSFGGNTVLNNIDLSIKPLEHTLVTGENGSGKSTLLGLITGDCPQCFSNDVTVLGYRRGSGESVWDIKANMGIVSNDLHRRYRLQCNALTAVCSGFFDSIGVYDPVSEQQKKIATQWLAAAGLEGRGNESFQALSYGEQRLVLMARALVKSPLLLILDEPTQGLDEANRQRVMNLLETLDARQHSTVIFVSHRQDEYLPLFRQHTHLPPPNQCNAP